MSTLDHLTTLSPTRFSNLLPDRSLVVSGTFGGPFVVYVLTPMRNALTLASQDRVSSVLQIYKRCFEGGVFRGWTGGVYPSIPAVPQFVTLGPLYHIYSGLLGPYMALFAAGVTESAFTFGAHSRNAQMAYNASVEPANRFTKLSPSWTVLGPGFIPHVWRNVVAMSGIRIFASPIQLELDRVFPSASVKSKRTASDFIGSMFSGILSTPFNQMFNYLATTRNAHEMTVRERMHFLNQFLKSQYFIRNKEGKLRPSRIMMRDIALRSLYSMGLFGIYATIERNLVDIWSADRSAAFSTNNT